VCWAILDRNAWCDDPVKGYYTGIDTNLSPLERVTIALLAVLLVAALVGVIKYDMQRTAATQPTTLVGINIRGAQTRPVSGRAAAVTPTLAVVDLLRCVPRFQLAQRVVDRGKGYRDAVVL
jgi:hypothetical protein